MSATIECHRFQVFLDVIEGLPFKLFYLCHSHVSIEDPRSGIPRHHHWETMFELFHSRH
jgi:hypothetical protein